MAETKTATEDGDFPAQPVNADGQADVCPSCKEAYCWLYGEDSMPTSLHCGHTLCFRCAKSQWCNSGSEDTPVFCTICSALVAVTTYKPSTVSLTENNTYNCSTGVQQVVSSSAKEVDVTEHTTPTQLTSCTEVIQQHVSGGKQNNIVGYSVEKVASAFSSPLVLDKIQSQDDAWRLLQHDEGFIRDWIVANVPDHVIFKMVGAGNPDSNSDSSSFVFNNSNTVVFPSPPKTDGTGPALDMTGMNGITSLPAVSSGFGESTIRPTFEQHVLQYLVSKATHDRPSRATGDGGEQGLPAASVCVESSVQTRHEPMDEERMGSTSVSVASQNRDMSNEMVEQGAAQRQSGVIGNKGDCGILSTGKEDSQFAPARQMVQISADGEASELATGTSLQACSLVSSSTQEILTEDIPYDEHADSCQPSVKLQHQPTVTGNLCLHSATKDSSFQSPNQHFHTSSLAGSTHLNGTNYSNCPDKTVCFSNPRPSVRAHGPYRNCSYMYPYGQSLPEQYEFQYGNVPQILQSAGVHAYHPYMSQSESRFGRGCGAPFLHPFRMSTEYSWSSKACNVAMNPASLTRFPAKSQIRFVQVVRPKSEGSATGLPESVELAEGTTMALPDRPSDIVTATHFTNAETQEESEAEVAVMKTRDMPHGIQVEDIYVVPQVWLSDGQSPLPADSSHQTTCPVCPCPSTYSYPVPTVSAVDQQTAINQHNSHISSLKHDDAEKYSCEFLNIENENVQALPGTGVSLGMPVETSADGMKEGAEADYIGLSDTVQDQRHSADDGSDYTGFKPVAVVTAVPVSQDKVSTEPCVETSVQVAIDVSPSITHSSTFQTSQSASVSQPSSSQSNTETPVRVSLTENCQGCPIIPIPTAPMKKIPENRQMQERIQLGAAVLQCQNTNTFSSRATVSNQTATCNSAVQNMDDSELSRQIMIDTQTSQASEDVEIVESKSTVPSAVMLPKDNSTTHVHLFPGKKRLRRSLSSEFFCSSLATDQNLCTRKNPDGRSYNRSGKWHPPRYAPYNYSSHQHTLYPYNFSFNRTPGCQSNGRMAWYKSAVDYRQPPFKNDFLVQPDLESSADSHLCMPSSNECVPRHRSRSAYSLLRGFTAYDSRVRYPTSLSESNSDVLSQLAYGQRSFNGGSCPYTQKTLYHNYQQNQACNYEGQTHPTHISDDFLCQRSAGITSQRLHFWPEGGGDRRVNGESTAAGALRIGSVGHTISARDLETLQWLVQEISELNKQVQNIVLSRLEGCLTLLQSYACQEGKQSSFTAVHRGQDVGDMDRLWQCILSLGQVVVHYGWWCRPHCWDDSSERWAEMAMLASQVFENNLEKLNRIVTFYLDHASVMLKNNEAEAPGNVNDRELEDISSDESQKVDAASTSTVEGCAQDQHALNSSQPPQSLPSVYPQVYRPAVYTTPVDNSQSCGTFSLKPPNSDVTVGLDDSSRETAPDTSDTHRVAAAFSHSEDGIPPFSQHGSDMIVGHLAEDIGTTGRQIYCRAGGHSQDLLATETQVFNLCEGNATVSVRSDCYHSESNYTTGQLLSTDYGTRADAYATNLKMPICGSKPQACSTYVKPGVLSIKAANTASVLARDGKTEISALITESAFNGDVAGSEEGHGGAGSGTGHDPALQQNIKATDCTLDAHTNGLQHSAANLITTASLETEDFELVSSHLQGKESSVVVWGVTDEQVPQMEIYYTVEGALMNNLTTDSQALTSSSTLCPTSERQGSDNIVFTVSHLEGDSEAAELPKEQTYIMSSECIDEETPAFQEEIPLEPACIVSESNADGSHSSVEDGHEPTQYFVKVETSGDTFDDALSVTVATDTCTDAAEPDVTAREDQTIYHSEESEVNLFTVTVPAEQGNTSRELMCTAEEVISDAAIMLSQTVEVETDGTVEVERGVKSAEPSEAAPLAQGSSPSDKENVDTRTYSGKRKCCKPPQSNSKVLRQDPCVKKQVKTASTKGGKWNLRSSKKSPSKINQSPSLFRKV